RYQRARDALDAATAKVARAQRRTAELARPARAAEERIAAAGRREADAVEDRRERRERETFGLRLGWVLLAMAAAFGVFDRLRRRQSRYLVVGMAGVAFATVQALVMATDYTTDEIELTEQGPLVLSLAGIALTSAAIVALQRYLARRLPARRVRRRECPFCGFPVTGEREHCEDCGRAVVAACSTCEAPRRVGTRHCGACGSA
ncbi:MAG TPA: zinc ribbon domain-containing protein, partial [Solirubrobacteraceae bacterium]|nr:zinc ribbon domain-containing protein [Solirubrobacteraceae bacterium]